MASVQPEINSNYSGSQAGDYIGACMKSGLTLAEGNITLLENVKYKRSLTVVDSSNIISTDGDCSFSPGTMSLTDRTITPLKQKLNVELCKRNLETDWMAQNMTPGVTNSGMDADFTAFIMEYLGSAIGENVENKIWSDLELAAVADGTVVDVVGTTLTALNIVDELNKIVKVIPDGCYGKEDLTLYLPTSAVKFYITAMSKLGYMNLYYGAEIPLTFEGIKIAHAPGLPANRMFATMKSNLFAATDLVSDYTDLRVVDMSTTDASQNIRVAGNFSIAANHAVGKDVVYYKG